MSRPIRARRRAAALLVALFALVTAGITAGTFGASAAPQAAPAGGESSAVTVTGHDDFAGLKVTVHQTQHLVNQVVKISWTGGVPTVSDTTFAANYLQIMQCWGDKSPDPDQCQFGGSSSLGAGTGAQAAGAFSNTRQLNYGGLADPEQTTLPPPVAPSTNSYVPFRSVTGDVSKSGNWNDFYDGNTSNEVPYGRTGSNGTGEVYFEMETSLEAPGLGCGDVPAGAPSTQGRSCWLVIVPRGTREVDGSSYLSQPNGLLRSSPLSASNWKERLVVPLHFEPVGNYCPIGADEVPTLGDEVVAEAMYRWQPALCQTGKKTIYSYAPATDDTSRSKLASLGDPGLVFLSRPPAADQQPADRRPVYAPVTLSGLTFGFFIESQAGFNADDQLKARNGTRLTSLNLTPRLVAKLLTESYQDGNSRFAPSTQKNPFNLGKDPEFLKYNPDYKGMDFGGALGDALVPEPLADATWQLWNWVDKDPAAHEFLSGVPDNQGTYGDPSFSGMTVNPNYRNIALPVTDYPKSDPFCQQFTDHPDAPLCVQDKHPYAQDMHTGARSVARGDTLARSTWDPTSLPPGYKKNPPQSAGQRAILCITDTATAARYGLVTAKLQNAAGAFVAPTSTSLLAGEAAMKPTGVPGVLQPDPRATNPALYPLSLLTYAATVPEALTKAEGQDLATLLTYAAGTGQQPGVAPGTLPDGYAPLPKALREQTLSAAAAVVSRSSGSAGAGSSGGASGGSSGGSTGGSSGGAGGSTGGSSGGSASSTSGGVTGGTSGGSSGGAAAPGGKPGAHGSGASPSPSGSAKPGATPGAQAPAASHTLLTPPWALGALRYVLLIALILGLIAALGGPLLPRVVPRLSADLRTWLDHRGKP
ncbi:hypothetical protein [Actinacidiphila acididurans]|uniref:PBP domain-containing protein n=1 Tax=Actinacidiphila acididurans TaxID=2784346 RepID=A0ABS2TKB6_9ACTN|nr:hypothetical protein [Actinacidiphila acididurans]MBM9503785.1 hypothetical protein [Actinacidiphila acididurans]